MNIAVTTIAIALIVWVNWYFLFAGRAPVPAAISTPLATSGTVPAQAAQEITIRVEGGYDPSSIAVRAGQPVRLVFDRREDNPCSAEIVFPDFRIRKPLAAFASTSVEFTPPRPGTYEFSCGMGMLHGRVIAS